MSLTKKEIDSLIIKLKEKYENHAVKHGKSWFDINSFQERLDMAVVNKMNMEGFILAEISNFEKILEKIKKKKSDRSFSEKVDRIIEENLARVKKYPEIKFHPAAGIEISHFYGALNDFEQNYFPAMRVLVNYIDMRNKLNEMEDALEFMAMPRGKLPSKRIEDHSLLLSRRNVQEIEIEKDKNNYLKESAFILHDIINFCDAVIEKRDPELEPPFRPVKLFIEDSRKKNIIKIFSGLTGYGVILKIKEQASNIIEDFRLTAFKRI